MFFFLLSIHQNDLVRITFKENYFKFLIYQFDSVMNLALFFYFFLLKYDHDLTFQVGDEVKN